jgi:signal transduction histidine kinase
LSQAKDEAIKASHFKSELLAKVNHELRTPMGAIMGYAQLLQVGSYGELTEEQLHPIALILSSTNYLNVLVSTLLDQAQIEKGKFIFQRAPFDMVSLAAEVDASMRVLAEKTELEFEITIEPDFPPELIGDRVRIQQIWNNLLSNALKFTDQGFIHSNIRKYDSDYWVLEVADTGLGISKEIQPYIFDAFVQADGSPTRKHTGIGLGLSIVSQLVELMNGRMTLNSEVGKGTQFTIYLPYALADHDQS